MQPFKMILCTAWLWLYEISWRYRIDNRTSRGNKFDMWLFLSLHSINNHIKDINTWYGRRCSTNTIYQQRRLCMYEFCTSCLKIRLFQLFQWMFNMSLRRHAVKTLLRTHLCFIRKWTLLLFFSILCFMLCCIFVLWGSWSPNSVSSESIIPHFLYRKGNKKPPKI